METKIYVITDPLAISFLIADDIEGFTEYLDSDPYLDFGEPKTFLTETEATSFCEGLAADQDEANPTSYPLRSTESSDLPFIQAIEQY